MHAKVTKVAPQCSGVIVPRNWAETVSGQSPSAFLLKLHESLSAQTSSIKRTWMFGAVQNDSCVRSTEVFVCPLILFCWKCAIRFVYSCMTGALETAGIVGWKWILIFSPVNQVSWNFRAYHAHTCTHTHTHTHKTHTHTQRFVNMYIHTNTHTHTLSLSLSM